jgi:hypothetical protein
VRVDDAVSPDDFDIVTELAFEDRAGYEAWVSAMYAPSSGVAADEEQFLDRSRTRSYVVEEYTTAE